MKINLNTTIRLSHQTETWLLHADGRVTNRPTPEQILAEARHWMEWSEETSSRFATIYDDDERNVHVVETVHYNNYDATEEARFEWLCDAQAYCHQLNQKRLNEMCKLLPLINLPEDVEVYLGKVVRGQFVQERQCLVALELRNGMTVEETVHWSTNDITDRTYNFKKIETVIKQMIEKIDGFEYSSEVEMDL